MTHHQTRIVPSPLVTAPLMTINEVADLWKVSVRTVRRFTANGTLPVVRIGRTVRVTREAFEHFLTHHARR